MNIRSIITISAEGPSLCSSSNAKLHQFKINSGQKRRQEGIWTECCIINLLSTQQREGSDIYPAWPGSFSADGWRPSQIHHPLCMREKQFMTTEKLGKLPVFWLQKKKVAEFATSLVVFRRVGSSLVEMVRQQSMQCVLKRVKRSAVVWVKH